MTERRAYHALERAIALARLPDTTLRPRAMAMIRCESMLVAVVNDVEVVVK